jgi:hypothetical protein
MELKNIIINSDKKPTAIEVYGIEIDKNKLNTYKIANMSSHEGFKKEWNNIVRLPKETKAYGIEILTHNK